MRSPGIRPISLTSLVMALAIAGAAPSAGQAATKYFTLEHVDIEAHYDSSAGRFEIEYHDHDADDHFDVDDSVFVLGESVTRSGISAGAGFNFLGVAPGEELWVSPASLPTFLFGGPVDGLTPAVPFIGLANGGSADGFRRVRFEFDASQFSGPGVFSLFSDGGTLFMSSDPGQSPSQTALSTTHTHYNFAFSEEGDYILPFRVSGNRALTGTSWEGLSDTYFIRFQVGNAAVVPEPASLAMVSVAGLAALGLGLARRRRNGA
jgi:surface-anchored protein